MAETPAEPRFKIYWFKWPQGSFLLSYLLNPFILNPCDDKNQLEILANSTAQPSPLETLSLWAFCEHLWWFLSLYYTDAQGNTGEGGPWASHEGIIVDIQRQVSEDEKEPAGPWLNVCKPSNHLPKALLTHYWSRGWGAKESRKCTQSMYFQIKGQCWKITDGTLRPLSILDISALKHSTYTFLKKSLCFLSQLFCFLLDIRWCSNTKLAWWALRACF